MGDAPCAIEVALFTAMFDNRRENFSSRVRSDVESVWIHAALLEDIRGEQLVVNVTERSVQ